MEQQKIKWFKVENFLRVKYAEVDFSDDVVTIGGENGEGKSSVCKGLLALFMGKKAVPEDPVRHGAREAKLSCELEDGMTLRAVIEKDRSVKLELKNSDGSKPVKSARELLDSFNFHYGYYPQDFLEMSKRDQVTTLLRVLQLDGFDKLEARRAGYFDERTEVNRELTKCKAQYDKLPHYPEAPSEIQSAAKIISEMARIADARSHIEALKASREIKESNMREAKAEIARLQERIASLQNQCAVYGDELATIALDLEESEVPEDTDILHEQLNEIEEINAQVRANEARARKEIEVQELGYQSNALSEMLEGIDRQKKEMIAAAQFPIAGLSFSEEEILLDGVPLDQASDAQRWEVAIEIAFLLKPTLRLVYVRNGSLLTPTTRKRVAERTRAKGGQLMIEVAGEGPDITVLMEDGLVKEIREPRASNGNAISENVAAV